MRLARALAVLACLGGAVSLTACGPAAVDAGRLARAEGNAEWPSIGKGYSEQRYSPLTRINAGNVERLGLAWEAAFDTDRGQEATPLIVDGVLYTSTAWSKVYAFDAKTGAAKWTYDPKVSGEKGYDACCDVVNRGVALWKGRVYVGALDGRLIALDAKTGKEAWSVQTTDPSKPYTITGAPRVVKGKVIIGNGGAENGVRGYVSAYDAATGSMAWRFYMTPNPERKPDGAASDRIMREKAAGTWFGEGWKASGGGGTAWDGMAYDPDLDLLYVGVGNGSPWNYRARSDAKGDNLFLSSIVALKPETGDYVWHYQTTPGEGWDYTATQPMILAELQIAGQPRKVLMQAPKNGFFYVLDRRTGELLSAKPYGEVTWATGVDLKTGRPVEAPGSRYDLRPSMQAPGPLGAHNWHPMAYSPKTGLVYLPTQVLPGSYADDKSYKFNAGNRNNTGMGALTGATAADLKHLADLRARVRGELVAWDPVKGEPRWRVRHPFGWNAGVLATAGDLVFQGAAEGYFAAYDARNGRKLWSYETVNGVIAAPATYEIDGEQYVAVMVGFGGPPAFSGSAAPPARTRMDGRLLVFKLGGTATSRPYASKLYPKLDLTAVRSAGDARKGEALYDANCRACHGAGAMGVFLPALRRTPHLMDSEAWKAVVIEGAAEANGMASFRRWLTPTDAEDIRAYVLAQARRPDPTAPAQAGTGVHGQ